MKKKIIATLFTAIIATSAFLMGHATTTATEKTMISVEDNKLMSNMKDIFEEIEDENY